MCWDKQYKELHALKKSSCVHQAKITNKQNLGKEWIDLNWPIWKSMKSVELSVLLHKHSTYFSKKLGWECSFWQILKESWQFQNINFQEKKNGRNSNHWKYTLKTNNYWNKRTYIFPPQGSFTALTIYVCNCMKSS